jgi:hypothetical protein
MELVVRVSVWIYQGLLLVYPPELRARFHADNDRGVRRFVARRRGSGWARGIAATWCTALGELGVAVPARLQPNLILAAGLSFLVSSLSRSSFLIINQLGFCCLCSLDMR